MKGALRFSPAWIQCLAVAALLQQIVTVSAVYSMSQTCLQRGSGFIADPNDCRRYGYCNNSLLMGTKQCEGNYVYNPRKGVCQYPTADVCTVGNVCQFAADKSHVANPSDCSSYYYCERKAGKLLYCPQNQIFDSNTNTCIWKSRSGNHVCAANSICRLVPDNVYVGDPDKCGGYVYCINGLGMPGKCDDGNFFNKALSGCQERNPCQASAPVGIGLGVAAPLLDSPEVCKSQETFPVWLPDKQTCMGYYVCTSKAGPGAWRKCNIGLHFDNGKCVTPYTFACKYDRCGNIKQQFVGAIDRNCRNYIRCQNQTSVAQTNVGDPCPPDNPFFNEWNQRCLEDSPASATYKLCVPA